MASSGRRRNSKKLTPFQRRTHACESQGGHFHGGCVLVGAGLRPGLGLMTQACLSLTTGFPVFDTHNSRCDACQFQYRSQDGFPGA